MSEETVRPQDLLEVFEAPNGRKIIVDNIEDLLGKKAAICFGEYCHHSQDGKGGYHLVLMEDYNQQFVRIAGFSIKDVFNAIAIRERDEGIQPSRLPRPKDYLPQSVQNSDYH